MRNANGHCGYYTENSKSVSTSRMQSCHFRLDLPVLAIASQPMVIGAILALGLGSIRPYELSGDPADIDQVKLATFSRVRRVNHDFAAVGTVAWVRIATPFALVLRW